RRGRPARTAQCSPSSARVRPAESVRLPRPSQSALPAPERFASCSPQETKPLPAGSGLQSQSHASSSFPPQTSIKTGLRPPESRHGVLKVGVGPEDGRLLLQHIGKKRRLLSVAIHRDPQLFAFCLLRQCRGVEQRPRFRQAAEFRVYIQNHLLFGILLGKRSLIRGVAQRFALMPLLPPVERLPLQEESGLHYVLWSEAHIGQRDVSERGAHVGNI